MTDPTARDLIQRLADALYKAEAALSDIEDAEREPGDDVQWCEDRASIALPITRLALTEARAYLAQPEPDGSAVPDGREPINQAPSNVAMQWCIPQSARMTFSCIAQECVKDNSDIPRYWSAVKKIEAGLIIASCEHARAVLARYGHQSPQPIPLSERQPTEADCDAEGMCWLLGKIESDWRLISMKNPGIPKLTYCFSHWLPYWALPVPAEVE